MQWILALALLVTAGDTTADSTPAAEYVDREVAGWTIRVHPRLITQEKRLEAGTDVIRSELLRVKQKLPEHAVERLQRVVFWLEDNPDRAAQYHPGRGWLEEHGFLTEKAGCIELQLSRLFNTPDVQQTNILLHELSHAYHHQVLGFEHPEIEEAFQRAQESGKYEHVLRHDGRHVRHYAMTNCREFFAEMSEAHFSVNDFYPFMRAELKKYDPGTADVIHHLWQEPPSPSNSSD